jgi:hypothetical protein
MVNCIITTFLFILGTDHIVIDFKNTWVIQVSLYMYKQEIVLNLLMKELQNKLVYL